MNDSQILERLAAEDPFGNATELPSTAWSNEVAYAEIERLVDATSGPEPLERVVAMRPRRPWLAAAGAFTVVLLIGVVLLLAARGGTELEPVATTANVPPTTADPPPTTQALLGDVVGIETQQLVDGLARAYNRGDGATLESLLAPDAVVSLAPSVSEGVSPSAVSLPQRAVTGVLYGERIRFEECLDFVTEIRCRVSFEDEFSDLLSLGPWLQTWTIQSSGDGIDRIEVSGSNPARAAAMSDFQAFIDGRAITGTPPLLAGGLEWNRSPEGRDVYRGSVVFFAALANGVSEEAYLLVTDFHAALNSGNIDAATALFAPGGQYIPVEASDDTSAGVYAESTEIGSPDLTEYFTFWYGMMQTDWVPVDCSGDGTTVTCLTESRGLMTLFLPGGVARGTVTYSFGTDGLVSIVDRTVRTGGSCGPSACAGDGFDLRGFWRAWMPSQPDLEPLWPDGNGNPPGGYDAELARAIIEFYPVYLAESGISVPPQFLDGSLLEGL